MPSATSASKKIDWRRRYDSLLDLVFKFRNDPKVPFADLAMRTSTAEKLSRYLRANERFVWVEIGAALHLRSASRPSEPSFAYIIPGSNGSFEVTLSARNHHHSLTIKGIKKAKAYVENHYEMLRKEED